MTTVNISDKAQAILALCKEKERLASFAESINLKGKSCLESLKSLSDEHSKILCMMRDCDDVIEKIALSCQN